MRTLLIIGFFTLLSMTGCQPEKKGSVIDIIISDASTSEQLSSLIHSYEIVKLDSRPEAFIKNPSRTIYCDSLILIKDESNQSIVIFNYKGKYLKTFSKRGRGPSEYLYISDYTFNPSENIISVYDNDKVKKFNLDGEFISETKLGFRPSKATRFDPNNTIIEKVMPSGDSISDFYIRLVGEDFKTKSALLPIKPLTGPGFGIEGQNIRTLVNGDHAYFFSYFADTVYHIDRKTIQPVYAFKYPKKVISVTNSTGEYDFDPNDALRYLSFFEIRDLNLLYYTYKNTNYCFVFNTSGSNSKLYRSTFTIRDVSDYQANILIDATSLNRFIELNDSDKKRCANLTDLNAALADSVKDYQCIIKISFQKI